MRSLAGQYLAISSASAGLENTATTHRIIIQCPLASSCPLEDSALARFLLLRLLPQLQLLLWSSSSSFWHTMDTDDGILWEHGRTLALDGWMVGVAEEENSGAPRKEGAI